MIPYSVFVLRSGLDVLDRARMKLTAHGGNSKEDSLYTTGLTAKAHSDIASPSAKEINQSGRVGRIRRAQWS